MKQHFHPNAKHLLYKYITPSFVGHSFRVKGETWYFFCQFTIVHFDLISNIFVSLCKYSRTLRMKPLTRCRVVSQAGLSDRAGLGLKFVKIFQADFRPAYKTFL